MSIESSLTQPTFNLRRIVRQVFWAQMWSIVAAASIVAVSAGQLVIWLDDPKRDARGGIPTPADTLLDASSASRDGWRESFALPSSIAALVLAVAVAWLLSSLISRRVSAMFHAVLYSLGVAAEADVHEPDPSAVYELQAELSRLIDWRLMDTLRMGARFYHHEFSNQLLALQLKTELLEARVAPDVQSSVTQLREEIYALREYVAAIDNWRMRKTVSCTVEDAFNRFRSTFDGKPVQWQVRAQPNSRIAGPFPFVRAIITNLVNNALKHSIQPPKVVVHVDEHLPDPMREECRQIRIQVEDRGPEISAAHLRRLFESPDSSSAHGFGLALCRRLATTLGGELFYQPPCSTCENCGQTVDWQAVRCAYCGSRLTPPNESPGKSFVVHLPVNGGTT